MPDPIHHRPDHSRLDRLPVRCTAGALLANLFVSQLVIVFACPPLRASASLIGDDTGAPSVCPPEHLSEFGTRLDTQLPVDVAQVG